MRHVVLFALVVLSILGPLAVAAAEEPYYVLPFKPDPAIVVDGDLSDWANVPNAIVLNQRENVTFGAELWTGPDDLSAVIRLAWRQGGLMVAAEVTDDVVLQPYTGHDIHRGDHLNLWFDWTPGVEPQRTMIGQGQVHVAISPGNFGGTAGGEGSNPPEIHVFRPAGLPVEGGEVAVRRTERGYILEAFIPFSRLGTADPVMFQDANFEVAISEADADPAKQETLITRGTAKWFYSRDRLLPMVFGDGNGKAPPPVRGTPLLESAVLNPQQALTLEFDAPAVPEGKEAFLFFKAHATARRTEGYCTNGVLVQLNGEPASTIARLSNRPPRSTMMGGRDIGVVSVSHGATLPRSVDFTSIDRDVNYGLLDNVKAAEFEFNLTGLVMEGKNILTFKSGVATAEADVTVPLAAVELRIKAKAPPAPPPTPAPTGEIPVIAPAKDIVKPYANVTRASDRVSFRVAGKAVSVTSRFTTPDGQWRTGSNPFFRHERQVIEHEEWIEVRDTFTNLTREDLPIIQEHGCDLSKTIQGAWLGGLEVRGPSGARAESANPSAFAITDTFGVGLMPLNDEFQVHATQGLSEGRITLGDWTFYLPPGKSYTAEWAIVPVARPQFWDFVNAARRIRDVNYTLKYMFAFMFGRQPAYEWPEATLRNFIDHKGANFIVQSIDVLRTKKGHTARCTDWLAGPHDVYVDQIKRIREHYPEGDIKTGIYFHCFLDTTDENLERFKDDRGLDAAGNHIDYGGAHTYQRLFIPTLEPGHWGEECAKMIDVMFNDIKTDGIFWDEFTQSRAKYVYNMLDGCSADINSRTFKLERKKGAVPLLSRDYRYQIAKRVLDEGRPLVVSGAPYTRTLRELKFMAFCETGSISNCRQMILHSPVALGDHLTENTYKDCYGVMHGALNNGCLYAWYGIRHHPNIAPTMYMFPFTPIELHEGYVIGQERIVTNRSGYFGWNDSSHFTAYVFDREGLPTEEVAVPRVERDGNAYGEVRLPEGYMAILVRQ